MPLILPVIMCGGAGTRLWPESRESLPKQFLTLIGARTSFQETAAMFSDGAVFAPPLVVTNRDYLDLVLAQLAEIGVAADVVLEPMRRDSGPAVAAAAEIARRRDPKTIVVVMAADHHVRDRAGLVALFVRAARAAERGYIVTLGITPDRPATGYGYLRPGHALEGEVSRLEAFIEKPDEAAARAHIAAGYLWNSGNFIFPAGLMLDEIAAFEPRMAQAAAQAVADATRERGVLTLAAEAFARAPKKSIDYAVMERTRKAAVIAADVGWSDIGAWSAVADLSPRDEAGHALRGDAVILDSENVTVRSQGLLTAVVGVKDVIVVATPDAVLVVGARHADKVKDLVARLREGERPEVVAHRLATPAEKA